MKKLLVALYLLAMVVVPVKADEVIMFCQLNVEEDVFITITREQESDTWTLAERSLKGNIYDTRHASKIGISIKGESKRNMTFDIYFSRTDYTFAISVTKTGLDVVGHVKELNHGTETNYRECKPNGIAFNVNSKAFLSENLTHVDED